MPAELLWSCSIGKDTVHAQHRGHCLYMYAVQIGFHGHSELNICMSVQVLAQGAEAVEPGVTCMIGQVLLWQTPTLKMCRAMPSVIHYLTRDLYRRAVSDYIS